jgi:hypothetical protein
VKRNNFKAKLKIKQENRVKYYFFLHFLNHLRLINIKNIFIIKNKSINYLEIFSANKPVLGKEENIVNFLK